IVYALTTRGQALEEAVLALGRWGAQILGEPRPDEIVTADSLVMALRTCFQPAAARGVHLGFELRFGEIVLHARVDDGVVVAAEGPLAAADLVISTGPALKLLLARELTPAAAIAGGHVQLIGDPALLGRFVQLFAILAT
ncbi:MAG: hypothetical protein JNK56_34375, partial [Myxococcales bacterium]|nr:hypothetical protein [Myxococcales bacterium]